MSTMTIAEIARQTGRSHHMVRAVIKRLNIPASHTEPVGRFHRQYFETEVIFTELEKTKPMRRTGAQNRHLRY
jgi:DNA-binding transcriptional regulator GbsR (MarR family)